MSEAPKRARRSVPKKAISDDYVYFGDDDNDDIPVLDEPYNPPKRRSVFWCSSWDLYCPRAVGVNSPLSEARCHARCVFLWNMQFSCLQWPTDP